MKPALAAEGIGFAYERDAPVLRDVSVAVASGTFTGLIGPNGSGKSTLLRILCGLLTPNRGTVTLGGQALPAHSPRDRARMIAFMPQAVNPAFTLRVYEAAALGRYPHAGALAALTPQDHAVIERCLRAADVWEFRDRDFATLSGGERQRVVLASILAQEPCLLLLDEPTSALDLHHQFEIFTLLRSLADEGYGVCVVTHDLNLAARFCDRVYLLSADHGLLAEGPPAAVCTEALLSQAYGAAIRVCGHPLYDAPLIAVAPAGDER